METSERFNLRWDAFETNTRVSLVELREEAEFFDVTLVSGDGKQVKASKVILACGSSFFHKILRENPHPHPLIYLKEVKHKHLMSVLDFLYTGEASIVQGDLNQFLDVAEDLKIKGLTLPDKSLAKTDAPLQSEVSAEENPHVKNKTSPPSLIPSPRGEMDAEENALAKTSPPSVIPAPQGQVAAHYQCSAKSKSSPQSVKPGLVSAHECTSSSRESLLRNMTPELDHSSIAFPKSTGEDDTGNIKVEVGNAEGYNVCYGINDQGEQYITGVSKRDLNSNEKDPRYLRKRNLEQGHKDLRISARKKPKEELSDSISDTFHANAVDSVVRNEENDSMIPAGGHSYIEKDKNKNDDFKDEVVDSKYDMVITEVANSDFINEQSADDWYEQDNDIKGNHEKQELEQDLNDEEFSNGERDTPCSICTKMFASASALKIHMNSHNGKKPFQCSVCPQKFAQLSDFSRHTRIHTGEKPYQCLVCSKSFSRQSHLKIHERVHTGEKPYQCLVCTKSFSKRGNLKDHERVHTGEKPYQCLVCTKSFSLQCTLKGHQRMHTGEKPYQCLVCSKSFSRQSHLKDHERVHTGEKPYQCLVCTKSFSHSSTLKDHERIHTGEKPYQCNHCPKTFPTASHLSRHKKSHTGEKPHQ